MISAIAALAAGNAVQIAVHPAAGAQTWRILRNTTGTFSGPSDTTATNVYEGAGEDVVDAADLQNGTLYYYQLYWYDGTQWNADAVYSVTPNATYQGQSVDVQTLLRDRLSAGLAVEISRGTLTPKSGAIKVLNAPPQWERTPWPVVTVHLDANQPEERGVGEELGPDEHAVGSSDWEEGDGWMARWRVPVVIWSLNPDERIALREAVKRVLLANMAVFDGLGLDLIEWNVQDQEDLTSYPSPVYQSLVSFSCVAPEFVGHTVPAISDVTVTGGVSEQFRY